MKHVTKKIKKIGLPPINFHKQRFETVENYFIVILFRCDGLIKQSTLYFF